MKLYTKLKDTGIQQELTAKIGNRLFKSRKKEEIKRRQSTCSLLNNKQEQQDKNVSSTKKTIKRAQSFSKGNKIEIKLENKIENYKLFVPSIFRKSSTILLPPYDITEKYEKFIKSLYESYNELCEFFIYIEAIAWRLFTSSKYGKNYKKGSIYKTFFYQEIITDSIITVLKNLININIDCNRKC